VLGAIIGVIVSGLFALLVAYIVYALFDVVFEFGKL
jgi:hypothetical protein